VLAQTPSGPRLIMENGTVEQTAESGAKLSVLKFKRYVFDLDQFASQQQAQNLETSERFLSELFTPHLTKDPGGRTKRLFLAEAHNRLSAPLYCLMFAFIALAAVTRGRRGRGAYALRLTIASVAAGAIRLLGYGAQGMVGRNPSLFPVLYLIPLLGALFAMLEINGSDFAALRNLLRAPQPEPAQ